MGQLIVSDDTLNELVSVISRPKFDRYISLQDRKDFFRFLGRVVERVTIIRNIQACPEPVSFYSDNHTQRVSGSFPLMGAHGECLENQNLHGLLWVIMITSAKKAGWTGDEQRAGICKSPRTTC